jgi:hypothetical protein
MEEKKSKKPAKEFEEFSDKEETEPEDIYNEEAREEMLEGDEISANEEGFMRGFEGDIEGGKKRKKDSEHGDQTSVDLAKEQYTED